MTDEQIITLFGQVPHFIDEVIIPLPDIEFLEFTQAHTTSFYNAYEASINLLEVVGTQHPDYAGLSWREFLSKGRRMPGNIRAFQRNPDYYTAVQKRLPNMHYLKINGQTFVTEDGNHRTCIGKCFLYGRDNPYIHGVHLVEREVDFYLAAQVRLLKECAPPDCQINILQKHTGRNDGPGWYRDFYALSVEVDRDGRVVSRATAEEMASLPTGELIERLIP